jgi:gamma-glutamylcyclotransferase (GGCT)/AIG2-like uncharacterized protein YtfP
VSRTRRERVISPILAALIYKYPPSPALSGTLPLQGGGKRIRTTEFLDMKNIFTYGSLMFPVVWQRVVRGEYRSELGTIHGFRRVAVREKEHPALIIAKGAPQVEGRVYFDVSDEDIARLDHFETHRYARVGVVVAIDGKPVVADAYLALNHEELTDNDWDVARFEREGLPRFLEGYVKVHALE